jgi:hypothetical protein
MLEKNSVSEKDFCSLIESEEESDSPSEMKSERETCSQYDSENEIGSL